MSDTLLPDLYADKLIAMGDESGPTSPDGDLFQQQEVSLEADDDTLVPNAQLSKLVAVIINKLIILLFIFNEFYWMTLRARPDDA